MQMIELGDGWRTFEQDMIGRGRSIFEAASDGLAEGGQMIAGHVVSEYLSGQYLKRRSGMLAGAVMSWQQNANSVSIGIPDGSNVDQYKWLLGDETKTITPKKGKYLAIPAGENFTPSGVPRFTSPRQVDDGFFVRKGGQLLFGRKNGKRGKFRLLFAFTKSVTIHGTGALIDATLEKLDDVTALIQDKINGVLKD